MTKNTEYDSKILAALAALPEVLAQMQSVESRLAALEEAFNGPPRKTAKRFYSIRDAAAELDVSEKSIHRFIERKLLIPVRGIRHIKIPAEEIDAYRGRATV